MKVKKINDCVWAVYIKLPTGNLTVAEIRKENKRYPYKVTMRGLSQGGIRNLKEAKDFIECEILNRIGSV